MASVTLYYGNGMNELRLSRLAILGRFGLILIGSIAWPLVVAYTYFSIAAPPRSGTQAQWLISSSLLFGSVMLATDCLLIRLLHRRWSLRLTYTVVVDLIILIVQLVLAACLFLLFALASVPHMPG